MHEENRQMTSKYGGPILRTTNYKDVYMSIIKYIRKWPKLQLIYLSGY